MIQKVKNYNSFSRQLMFVSLLVVVGFVILRQLSFFCRIVFRCNNYLYRRAEFFFPYYR